MAYRRSVSTTATLVTRRFHPSFTHILNDDKEDTKMHSRSSTSQSNIINILPSSTVGSCFGYQGRGRTGSSLAWQMGIGSFYCRHMSTTIGDGSDKMDDVGYIAEVIPDGSNKIDDIGYIAEVMSDKTVEVVASQGPAVSEVAVAAADSFFPVAALQYLVDYVHSFTGLNWWASIALITILIRGATVPLLIDQMRATSKLNLMRPHLEELQREMKNKAADPDSLAEGQKRMVKLFNEYGVTPFSQLKGLFIQGPIFISFFLAIRNMSEKVPSFKSGGALWFTDLTTPDSMLILPILTAMTFWITVEEGLEGNPIAKTMKTYSRILAVIAVPVMMSFPNALFCYWLTSNFFSLAYGSAIRLPVVKSFFNLPEIPVPPPTASQPPFSLFQAVQQDTTIESEPSLKIADRGIPSSSVLKQRLKSLEKQIKRRKKQTE